jgi:hypothetical protein
VTQSGLGVVQFELLVHSTHPSVELHCWPPPQVSLPLTPHRALPLPIDELAPPHAPAATMIPKMTARVVPRILMKENLRLDREGRSWPPV